MGRDELGDWNRCVCTVCICACQVTSIMSDCATPWTVAHQAPLSMGFFRPEYWTGLPFPSAGDLPDPGIKLASGVSPGLQADSLPAEPSGKSHCITDPSSIF